MQILLNDEELDIQLENEKLLAEVLRGISNWIESDSHYLKEFILDGTHYFIQEQPKGEWDFDFFQHQLTQIEKLEIFSSPMQAYQQLELNKVHKNLISESENTILESLKTLSDYFQIIQNAFENRRFVFLQDFFSDSKPLFELIQRSIEQVKTILWQEHSEAECDPKQYKNHENSLLTELKACLSIWNYFQDHQQNAQAIKLWNKNAIRTDKNRMNEILKAIPLLLKDLHEHYTTWLLRPEQHKLNTQEQAEVSVVELAQPALFCDINITEIQKQLTQKSQELEEALVQLQSGQTQQIFYYVSELSLLLEQLIEQQEIQGNKKLETVFNQITPFLKELANAIEETDTVNIGDLVEYEIIPLIQQIIDLLAELVSIEKHKF